MRCKCARRGGRGRGRGRGGGLLVNGGGGMGEMGRGHVEMKNQQFSRPIVWIS